MYQSSTTKKYLLIIITSLMISACGGSSSDLNAKPSDSDNDNIINSLDNCPDVSNPTQTDSNNNGVGDACEILSTEQLALKKFSDYAASSGSSTPPSIQDYIDIGYSNLSAEQVAALNENISNRDSEDVDTIDEIKVIIDADPVTETEPTTPTDQTEVDKDNDGVIDEKDEFPENPNMAASVKSAHRLLTQATFGATQNEIERIVKIGTDAWLLQQLNAPSAYDSATDNHQTHLERTIEISSITDPETEYNSDNNIFNERASSQILKMQMSAWAENSLGHKVNTKHGSDQLRQRTAYALSQILVTSGLDATLGNHGESLAYYYDLLSQHALGNYRDLLGEISRSATMGVYLSHRANKKTDPALSIKPDENFARELIQLFVMGLYELNLDGSPNSDNDTSTYPDSGDTLVPSYSQLDVEELGKVMTGWDIRDNVTYGNPKVNKGNYAAAMVFHPEQHEDEAGIVGGDGNITILGKSIPLNSGTDGSGLDEVLDHLFAHDNVAPFISRRLITHFVTSNPSSDYVARISTIFNDNGNGIKGDLKAVLYAILSDREARDNDNNNNPHFGKIKEPLLASTQFFRAFNITTMDGIKGKKNSEGVRPTISGVYAFGDLKSVFGQGALRAKSVFNFYDDSFVPSDDYFSNNRLLSPESQLLTDQHMVDFNNFIYSFMWSFEKNRITKINSPPQTLAEYTENRVYGGYHAMLIDFDRELQLLEQALEGDSNGDFMSINDDDAKARAIDALISHLDSLLLGNKMTTEFKTSITEYLNNARSLNNANNFYKAHFIIRDAIRFIVTSSAYMIQK